MDNKEKYQFSADRPISSIDEDLLGRAGFAKSLADAIYSWNGKDSLVVALYGEWGSGKSSIKNMALSHLRQKDSLKPTIIEFSPWEWAAQEKITKAFFDEVSRAIGRQDKSEASKKTAEIFKKYGDYLAAGEAVLSETSSSIPIVLTFLAGIGFFSTWQDNNIITAVICIIAALIVPIKWGTEKLKAISGYFEEKSKGLEQSLDEIRSDLKSQLAKRDAPILIVMDDLDRLNTPELRMIFQLIKANIEFPNVTFLLIFQKDIVEKKLTDSTQLGKDYLEKIVQVPFTIPKIEESKVYQVLFNRINNILELDKTADKVFDQNRWANIFHSGLKFYFKDLRSVYRYTSTLEFYFNLLKGRKVFEANPVDLIAIECLRVFEADVYNELAVSKAFFTKNNSGLNNNPKAAYEKQVRSVISKSTEGNAETVEAILKELFPTIHWIIGNMSYDYSSYQKWFSESRICHENNFDQYFELTIGSNSVSKSDLTEFLEATNDKNLLLERLLLMKENKSLKKFLEHFEAYNSKIPIENAYQYMLALEEMGDLVDDESDGFFGIYGNYTYIYRLFIRMLERIDDSKRFDLLKDIFSQSKNFLIFSRLLSYHTPENDSNSTAHYLIKQNDLTSLKDIFVNKIKFVSSEKDDTLLNKEQLLRLLYSWKNYGGIQDIKSWLSEETTEDGKLIIFLSKFIQKSKSHSGNDYTYQTHYYFKYSILEEFFDISILEQRISSLDKSSLDKEELKIVELFNTCIERKNNGQSDSSFDD